jgi:hypothetical protein
MYRRIKKTALILAFLVCFVNYQGFACGSRQRTTPTSTPSEPVENSAIDTNINTIKNDISRINEGIVRIEGKLPQGGQGAQPSIQTTDKLPVTPEIVGYLLENSGGAEVLKYYVSKEFTLKIYGQDKNSGINISDNMIIINPVDPDDEKNVKETIVFTTASEGIWIKFGSDPDKGREITIYFKDQNKALLFLRNRQQDCYVLSKVEMDGNYITTPSETIQLYVSGRNNQPIQPAEVKVASAGSDNSQTRRAQPSESRNNGNASSSNVSQRSVTPSRNILGEGSIKTPDRVITYVYARGNPVLNRSEIQRLINTYISEADFEDVNVDIAIAQMLRWTNSLKNRERVATNNYGGLSRIDGWNGRFPRLLRDGMTEGVRAHIQHIKAYASTTIERPQIVDPRYYVLKNLNYIGTVRTFDQLYRKWSVDSSYGQAINVILRNL